MSGAEKSAEERAFLEFGRRSSWGASGPDPFRDRDIDAIVSRYAPDALSIPANHGALRGHDEIRAWYTRRLGDHDMNSVSQLDTVDIVGDLAITSGIFRVTRAPEDGVGSTAPPTGADGTALREGGE